MLQAIIFDHDGTIVPSSKRQEQWFKHWSKLHNVDWPFQDFSEFLNFYNTNVHKPNGVQNVYDAMKLPCNMKDNNHPVWHAFNAFNKEHPLKPYDGIVETIKEIWRMGSLNDRPGRWTRTRLGINTSNSWESISHDLRNAGLLEYFDTIVTEEVLRNFHGTDSQSIIKPSTIPIGIMLGLLNTSGSYTLHVGDTLNDLRCSQKVLRLNPMRPESLITIGACYGYEGRTILEQGVELGTTTVKFNHLIDKPQELIPIVQEYLLS